MDGHFFGNRGLINIRGGIMHRVAALAENKLLSLGKFLLLPLSIVSMLLIPVMAFAQNAPATITLVSNLTYLDPVKGEVQVKLIYYGTHSHGRAVATYTSPDGSEIVDEMRDCTLVIANGAWSINCSNPHFRTWDTTRYWYAVSSDTITQGKLMYFDLVGPVTVSLRYDAPRE